MITRDDMIKLRGRLDAIEDPAPLQLLQAAVENLWLARYAKTEGWADSAIRAHLDLADQHWRRLDAYLAKKQPIRQTLLDVLDVTLMGTQPGGGN